MRLNSLRPLWLSMCALLLLASCLWGDTCYYRYRSVGDDWQAGDTLLFDLPQEPFGGGQSHDLLIAVRYTDAYCFRNLILSIQTEPSDTARQVAVVDTARQVVDAARQVESDTLTIPLYDEEGKPLGKGIASLYQIEQLWRVYGEADSCPRRIIISHLMPDNLSGAISDIGLRVVRR